MRTSEEATLIVPAGGIRAPHAVGFGRRGIRTELRAGPEIRRTQKTQSSPVKSFFYSHDKNLEFYSLGPRS
jgi:hypothetical protein